MGDTDEIPLDLELEAEFDPHESPTKLERPRDCVPREDFRALLAAVVTIERCYTVGQYAFRETQRMAEHREAMVRLCEIYGVER